VITYSKNLYYHIKYTRPYINLIYDNICVQEMCQIIVDHYWISNINAIQKSTEVFIFYSLSINGNRRFDLIYYYHSNNSTCCLPIYCDKNSSSLDYACALHATYQDTSFWRVFVCKSTSKPQWVMDEDEVVEKISYCSRAINKNTNTSVLEVVLCLWRTTALTQVIFEMGCVIHW